jgi:hypothetical protein
VPTITEAAGLKEFAEQIKAAAKEAIEQDTIPSGVWTLKPPVLLIGKKTRGEFHARVLNMSKDNSFTVDLVERPQGWHSIQQFELPEIDQ